MAINKEAFCVIKLVALSAIKIIIQWQQYLIIIKQQILMTRKIIVQYIHVIVDFYNFKIKSYRNIKFWIKKCAIKKDSIVNIDTKL